MRIEHEVVMPELWIGRTKINDEVRRSYVVLSQRERDTLRRAAKIMERVRELANDLDDGLELDIRDDDMWRAVALGEGGAWELAESGEVATASTRYPELAR